MRPNLASQFPWPKSLKPARHQRNDCCPVFGCQPGNFLDHSLGAFFITLAKRQGVERFGHVLGQHCGYLEAPCTPWWGLTTSQPDLSRKTMTTPGLWDPARGLFLVAQRLPVGCFLRRKGRQRVLQLRDLLQPGY